MKQTKSKLLTVGEVANILRVDPSTVRRWIKQGSLEAVPLPTQGRGQRLTHRVERSTIERDFHLSL
uniref:Helix-turn-helix domain-containing protein n=1 Tax=Thermosporothrix sp. COM3 TaxID=2490863 RepID=A0A455SX76_9CHLR|nr:hypothetical protein KTC_65220 [Thermosporothrix sp. COM3]